MLAGVLIAAGCGGGDDDDDNASGENNGTDTTAVESVEETESRFVSDDAFCDPAEAESEEAPEATGPGITAEEVQISHVRVQLEKLEEIGFAIPLGDPADQAETFVEILNEVCGGVNGRQVNLHTVEMEIPGLASDADADAQRVCIEVSEDKESVVAYSLSGAGGQIARCTAIQNDVIFVTTYAISPSEIEESEGRLFSMTYAPSELLTASVEEFSAELEGKRIGVVHQDSLGDPEIVQTGLVQALEDAGHEVVRVDALGCNNSSRCTDNVIPSVQGMINDDVDVIFPLLNVVSLPGYLQEMATQGVKPGDIQFLNVGYLAQDGELVTGKIVEFAGEPAGQLYDGAKILSGTRGGQHRLPDYEPDPFAVTCNELYAEHSDEVTEPYDPRNDEETSKFGAVAGQCALIRVIARAIEAAGPNPSREDVAEAMANLGEIQLASGAPASFSPDKTTAPDSVATVEFRFPCPEETTNPSGACLVPGELTPFPGR